MFTVENNIQKRENLENAKKVVAEFKERLSTKVRKQKKLDIIEKQDFKRERLLEKYMVKMLDR